MTIDSDIYFDHNIYTAVQVIELLKIVQNYLLTDVLFQSVFQTIGEG